ncbi:cytochrome c oxidase subunit 3 [Novosphingobium sp. JCM 18896]|uniref:cytochrome c oxidase subunit 3 n=1 Tax=Novosphingobium sp. JCM 18896 TaxID=2989731 RepID=UPI00222300FC|nr:cytochrome c oxidase subunit 3 [Novosphingobium sp. JCM 18896]MCW1430769.1 cytochrome c oxidase subunit 3 [Novosphingobium sp. JCM 18896]
MTEVARARPTSSDDGQERMPGQSDMWVLVMIEAITFSSYFVVYTIYYCRSAEAFLRSQSQLDLALGVINTLILLASSWSVARCVERARAGDHRAATRNLALTAGGGLLFAALKLHEWSVEIGRGNFFSTDEFFSFYYFLTGMHLLHVLVGFIALGVVYYQLKSPARRSLEVIETGATFWHMVDFLWVIIFALLYVMR